MARVMLLLLLLLLLLSVLCRPVGCPIDRQEDRGGVAVQGLSCVVRSCASLVAHACLARSAQLLSQNALTRGWLVAAVERMKGSVMVRQRMRLSTACLFALS